MRTKIPPYQTALKRAGFTFIAMMIAGSVLDTLSNAFTIITPPITYIGSVFLAILWAAISWYLARKGLPWVVAGQLTVLRRLGPMHVAGLPGILLVLWLPRLFGGWVAPTQRGVLTVEIGPAVRDSLGAPQRGNASFVGGYTIGDHYPRFVPHEKRRNPTLTLRYDAWSSGDTTWFAGHLPYRDDVLTGRRVEGIGIGYDGYFSWEYPKLGVHVVNNTNRTYQLTQAIVTVERSDLDLEPIPVLDAFAFSLGWPDPTSAIDSGVPDRLGLRVVNNGWGPIINPRFRFALGYGEHGESLWALGPGNVQLPFVATAAAIDSFAFVPLEDSIVGGVRTSEYLTPDFFAAADSIRMRLGDFWLTVVGVLDYRTAAGQTRSVPFRTAIEQTGGFGDGFDENTYPYDICLPAGKVGSYRFRLAQHVKAGETDRFSIKLGSDRSARFMIHVAFRATGGETFDAGSAVVDVFVPSRKGEADRWCTSDQAAVPIGTELR